MNAKTIPRRRRPARPSPRASGPTLPRRVSPAPAASVAVSPGGRLYPHEFYYCRDTNLSRSPLESYGTYRGLPVVGREYIWGPGFVWPPPEHYGPLIKMVRWSWLP